jgi:hypothetical protein
MVVAVAIGEATWRSAACGLSGAAERVDHSSASQSCSGDFRFSNATHLKPACSQFHVPASHYLSNSFSPQKHRTSRLSKKRRWQAPRSKVIAEPSLRQSHGDASQIPVEKTSRADSQERLLTVVMKFGGSSVANADRLREVAKLILSFPQERPIIVMSAMGKTTNLLLAVSPLKP